MNKYNKYIKSLLPDFIFNFFTKGHSRTLKIKKQITLSYIYRGIDIGIGFLMIPLVLGYLDKERYGIWLLLFSITSYFRFMDVGIGNGLRNKFAEAKAEGNMERVKHYVSTTYATVSIISLSFFILFLIINPFLNWTKLLNTTDIPNKELSILAVFVFGSFAFQFILKTITTILTADQRPSIINLQGLLTRFIKVIILILLLNFTKGSLLKLGISFSLVNVIVLTGLTIYYFSKDYKQYRPAIKYINFSYLKDLMQLGIKFFIISITGVVLFTTDSMIIAQLFGPKEVVPYQLANRYFGIPLMLFIIIVTPLWSAVTDAYSKNDFNWIKNTIKKMQKIWILFAGATILMLIVSPFVFKIWLGDKVSIPIFLSISWSLFVGLQTYNAIFVHFINGVGKLKLQLILTIFSIILNIPLSIFLAKYVNLGISGVILATSISVILSIVFTRIQYLKIINKKAIGIWNK